jgi:hypothetical protein
MSRQRIFISHAPADREWVRAFAESLKAEGALVWLDEWEVPVGKRVEEATEQGLRNSDLVAFVITADNVRAPNLLFEFGATVAMGKPAVPIVPKDMNTSELPYPFRVRRMLLRESPEETARRLLAETAA